VIRHSYSCLNHINSTKITVHNIKTEKKIVHPMSRLSA
jgi:hypothetical protein